MSDTDSQVGFAPPSTSTSEKDDTISSLAGDPINSRTTRLNHLILGLPEAASKVSRPVGEALSREGLLDALTLLFDECDKELLKKKHRPVFEFVQRYRDVITEANRLRVGLSDFTTKDLIAKGYFGEVHLVAENSTKDLYAIKKISKSATITAAQMKEERDIMAYKTSDWITSLQYAFQDADNLYLVMEYMPGGDLFSLMIRTGPFDEELTRFYLAEITLALHALHRQGYAHRDIKPENILLDRFGHLKLADFGSAVALNKNGTFASPSPVGTPNYIAPELLDALSASSSSGPAMHDATCDFWSMGIIGYELIFEETPFAGDQVLDTYAAIQAHAAAGAKELSIPSSVSVSPAFSSLIRGLVQRRSRRLTYTKIRQHVFFKDTDWEGLRHRVPPIIPTLSYEEDTSNFEHHDRKEENRRSGTYEKQPGREAAVFANPRSKDFSGQNLPFVGYSYVAQAELGTAEDTAMSVPTASRHSILGRQPQADVDRQVRELKRTIEKQAAELRQLGADLTAEQHRSGSKERLERLLRESQEEMDRRKVELRARTAELSAARMEAKTLRSSLKIEEEARAKRDANITQVLNATYQKWENVKRVQDKSFEKRLSQKVTEIADLTAKLQGCDQELAAKVAECQRLEERMKSTRETWRTSKANHEKERFKLEHETASAIAKSETQVRELKAALQLEEAARLSAQTELQSLQRDLNESVSSVQSAEQSRVVADRNADEVGQRLREQLLENQTVRAENAAAKRSISDMQRRLEETQREMMRLRQEQQQQLDVLRQQHQEQTAELQLHHTELAEQLCKQRDAAVASRRSSCGASSEKFRSAQGSLESLVTTEVSVFSQEQFDQLRNDLAVTKDAELEQRTRAERMEEMVTRLELVIAQLQPKPQDGLLERQNSKLEDQLTSVREQAIVERQASRSAHLSLYKLEKQLELEVEEKKRALRRVELSDERVTKMRIEKEEVERQMRDKTATIAGRQERIDELLAAVAELKADAKRQLELWRSSEEERTHLKSAVFEKTHTIYQAEQTAAAMRLECDQLQQRVQDARDELEAVLVERDAVQQRLTLSSEECATLDRKLKEGQQNIRLLKYASTTMEDSLNDLDEQLAKERLVVSTQKQRIEELEATSERHIAELSTWRLKFDAEAADRQQLDTHCAELEAQLQEERERIDDKCRQLLASGQLTEELQHTDTEQRMTIERCRADIQCLQLTNQNYTDELMALKEENSRLLSDLYRAKDELQRQTVAAEQDRLEAASEVAGLHTTADALRGTLEERLCYFKNREIKADATQAQLKKLVHYLQERVYDLQQKQPKKTRLAELFKSSNGKSKENVPVRGGALGYGLEEAANGTMSQAARETLVRKMRDCKEELQRERERCAKLKEQLIQAKTIIQRAGLGERTTAAVFPDDSADAADVEDVFAAPPVVDATPQRATKQPSAPTVDEVFQREEAPRPIVGDRLISPRQPVASRTEHRFEMTLDSAAPDAAADPSALIFLSCIACRTQINVERSYMRCRECKSCVHRKCRDAVSSSCEAEELRRMQHVQQRRGSERESLGLPGKHADDLDDPRVTEALDALLAGAPTGGSDGDLGVDVLPGRTGQEYAGEVVLRSAELSPPVSVNCVLEVQEGVLLLGTESGLYSYHTRTAQLVHIPPIASVTSLSASPALSKCLLIADSGRRLLFCDWRHLQSRAAASACLKPRLDVSTIDLPFANRVPTERWHHISVYEPPASAGDCATISSSNATLDAHVIACTSSRLVILRFDAAHNRFKPVCALDTARPVTGVLFTAYTAIVSSDKFFEIDLKSFQAEEFLDESDASCVEARSSGRPHAAFKVNSQEFLLCFAEFGVFVDTYGDRSRPDNLCWSAPEPLDFVYRDPLLFVAFPGWVEVVRINKSYSGGGGVDEVRGGLRAMRSVVVMQQPRLVGASGTHGAFVLQTKVGSGGGAVGGELVALDGIAALKTAVGNSTETLLSSVAHGGAAGGGTLRGSCETLSTIGNGLDSL